MQPENPMTKAKRKRRRRPKPGDMRSLQRTLWAAIRDVEAILHDAEGAASVEQRIRAAHALATVSGTYLKAWEAAELQARVEELEAAVRSA